jgi:nucleotide-binding universal stress UspA family protein
MSRTVVVGYDDTEPAKRALDRAIEEARDRKGKLVVVMVSEMPLDPGDPRNFGTLDDGPPAMAPGTLPPELEPWLDKARERIRLAGYQADYAWRAGTPAAAIVDEAERRRADLIVVGAHQGGFFSKVLGTDTAAEVERGAPTDVLVVD